MGSYIARRSLLMLVTIFLASIVSFMVIVLPPGDYVTSYVALLESQGADVGQAEIAALRQRYGLDKPVYVQYAKWMWNLLHGDLGYSFEWNEPVWDLIRERLPMTLAVSLASLVLTYAMAIPIGIYSAVRQYSIGDYVLTAIGFIGVSIPNFLLALILIVVMNTQFGMSAGGLFSVEYKAQPWSWGKFVNLLKHLPLPIVVIGLSGTAGLMRIMRGMLLDELNKPYVTTARAKGLSESRLLFKYPVRVALNPIVSSLGWSLPAIFSGQAIASIVLNLPTMGPLLYSALLTEDMFLAASVILVVTLLTVVGMLISDILLGWLDPRIRFQ
jgi:peptide/nickel transport system permease protein